MSDNEEQIRYEIHLINGNDEFTLNKGRHEILVSKIDEIELLLEHDGLRMYIPTSSLLRYLTTFRLDDIVDVAVAKINKICDMVFGYHLTSNESYSEEDSRVTRRPLLFGIDYKYYHDYFKQFIWYHNYTDYEGEGDLPSINPYVTRRFFNPYHIINFIERGNMINCDSILAYHIIRAANITPARIEVSGEDLLLAEIAMNLDVDVRFFSLSTLLYAAEIANISHVKTFRMIRMCDSYDQFMAGYSPLRELCHIMEKMSDGDRQIAIEDYDPCKMNITLMYRWMRPFLESLAKKSVLITDNPLISVYFPDIEYRTTVDAKLRTLPFSYNKNCSDFDEQVVLDIAGNVMRRTESQEDYTATITAIFTLILNNQLSRDALEALSTICPLYEWMITVSVDARGSTKSARSS
jgi:hypothetical protein